RQGRREVLLSRPAQKVCPWRHRTAEFGFLVLQRPRGPLAVPVELHRSRWREGKHDSQRPSSAESGCWIVEWPLHRLHSNPSRNRETLLSRKTRIRPRSIVSSWFFRGSSSSQNRSDQQGTAARSGERPAHTLGDECPSAPPSQSKVA